MAIQLVRNQLIDAIIDVNKLDNGAVSYAKILSTDIETDLAVSASSSKLASASAIKSYVDAQVPDSFSGGDGIDINTSGNPDVISVDLATSSPGLYFDTAKLSVQVKAEAGGTISKDANGLYIANSAISNAKLANSTISGVALGNSLGALSKATNGGIAMTSYDGSAAVSDLSLNFASLLSVTVDPSVDQLAILHDDDGSTKLESIVDFVNATKGNGLTASNGVASVLADGSTLSVSASGVKVADSGIGSTQIANSAVTPVKVSFGTQVDNFTGNGSATTFDLAVALESNFTVILLFRNGVALQQVQSAPSGVDQFTVSATGGAGGVGRITMGAAPTSSDFLVAFYVA